MDRAAKATEADLSAVAVIQTGHHGLDAMDEGGDPRLELTEAERAQLRAWASWLRQREWDGVARFLVESTGPLHFLASQTMIGLSPIVSVGDPLWRGRTPWQGLGWRGLATLLEKRGAANEFLRLLDESAEDPGEAEANGGARESGG